MKAEAEVTVTVKVAKIVLLVVLMVSSSEARPEDGLKEFGDDLEPEIQNNQEVKENIETDKEEKDDPLMLCPENVKSFSAGPDQRHYYACVKPGSVPVLKSCPPSQTYWARKQKCRSMDTSGGKRRVRRGIAFDTAMVSDLQTIVEPVLGRSVYLGCLYDGRRNRIMDADSLWSSETVEKYKRSHNAMSSHVSFSDARSSYERVKRSKIPENTKLDILGDMLDVSGSASYLKEHIEDSNTMAYTLSTHYTTRITTLPTTTPQDYNEQCKSIDGATHVVTSLKYGMEAYFTLIKDIPEQKKEEEYVKLIEAARHIPALAKSGTMKAELKDFPFTNDLYVRMRSDAILSVQPTTYGGSVRTFSEFTNHLGQPPFYNLSKEMIMTLTPITRFCNVTRQLFSISHKVIQQILAMLDSLEASMMSLKSLTKTQGFNPDDIHLLVQSLESFQQTIKADLKKVVPKVRAGLGGSGEKDLIAILSRYLTSPFHDVTLKKFLHRRMSEVATLQQLIDWNELKKQNITVLETDEEDVTNTKRFLMIKPAAVLVQFNILSPNTAVQDYLKDKTMPTSTWTSDDITIARMGHTMRAFAEFAASNNHTEYGFFFCTNHIKNETIEVFAQKNGQMITNQFEFPQQPAALMNVVSTFDSISFEIRKPGNKWITGFDLRQRSSRSGEKKTKFRFSSSNRYEVRGLEPNRVYYMSVRYVTEVGNSAFGIDVAVSTRASSPPESLRVDAVEESTFRIVWNPPLQVGSDARVAKYEVSVTFNIPGTGHFLEAETCKDTPIDISFVLDTSGSLSGSHFTSGKTFIKEVARALFTTSSSLRASVITFDSQAVERIRFSEHREANGFIQAVNRLPFSNGGTQIDRALSLAMSTILAYQEVGRTNVHKVVVLITDGHSSGNHVSVALSMRNKGIKIVTVGIGNSVHEETLRLISLSENYYHVNNFTDILVTQAFVKGIVKVSCEQSPTTPTTATPPSTPPPVPMIEYRTSGYCTSGFLSQSQCQQVAKSVGLAFMTKNASYRPYGCYVDVNNYNSPTLIYNTYTYHKYDNLCSQAYVCTCKYLKGPFTTASTVTTLPPTTPIENRYSGYCTTGFLSRSECQYLSLSVLKGISFSTVYSSSRPHGCYVDTTKPPLPTLWHNSYTYNKYDNLCSYSYTCLCKRGLSRTTSRPIRFGNPTTAPPGTIVFNNIIRFTAPMRGVDGNGTYIAGHVEVLYRIWNQWGTICHNTFDDHDAIVLCRMAGFEKGLYNNGAYKQKGVSRTGHVNLRNVHCYGNETSIFECVYNGWNHPDCGSSSINPEVGIKCYYKEPPATTRKPATEKPTPVQPTKEVPVTKKPKPTQPEHTQTVWIDTTTRPEGSLMTRRTSVGGEERSVVFKDTSFATKYNISVTAVLTTVDDPKQVSEKAVLVVVTGPSPPSQPILVNTSYHHIVIRWSPPSAISPDDVITGYVVKSDLLDEDGDVRKGRSLVRNVGNTKSFTIPHLEQKQMYAVSVKVNTVQGSSGYSLPLVVQTLSDSSDKDDEKTLMKMLELEIEKKVSPKISNLQLELKKQQHNNSRSMTKVKEQVKACMGGISSLERSLYNMTMKMDAMMDRDAEDNRSETKMNTGGTWNMTYISGKVSELSKDHEHAFLFRYPEYGYKLIGFGYYGKQSGVVTTSGRSANNCLKYCAQTRSTTSGAGVWYRMSDQKCGCTRGESGHTHDAKYLHFRYST